MTREDVEKIIRKLFEIHMPELEGMNKSDMLVHRDKLVRALDDRDTFNETLLECMVDLLSRDMLKFIGNLSSLQELLDVKWFKD